MKKLSLLTCPCLLLLALPYSASADSIASTMEYPSFASYYGIPSFVQMAFSFEIPSQSDYTLDAITLPMVLIAGQNMVDLWIAEDNNNRPGAVVEKFSLVDQLPVVAPWMDNSPITTTSSSNPYLQAGHQYWLGITSVGQGTTVELPWAYGANGLVSYNINDMQWALSTAEQHYSPAQFEITGRTAQTPVPEPTTLLLLGSGIVAVIGSRARQPIIK